MEDVNNRKVTDEKQNENIEEINTKLYKYFSGKIVRKDLTKKIKEGANVPVYVLEYLLGMYCSSINNEDIEEGLKTVKKYWLKIMSDQMKQKK